MAATSSIQRVSGSSVSGSRVPGSTGETRFAEDPASLLPLVFARPREALAGASFVLAHRPSAAAASFAYQAIGLVERDFGDTAAAIGHLRRAARLAARCGSADRQSDVLAALGIALIHSGRTAAGLRALQQALARAGGLTAARVRFRLAGALWVLGRHAEALAELRPAIAVLRRADDTIWLARALTLRGLLQLARGATDRASRDFGTAERLFSTTGQEHDCAVAVHNLGLVAARAGDLPAALRYLDEAARRYLALRVSMPELSMDRCGVLLAAGLPADALAEADSAITGPERLPGQATRRAELLLTGARAALAAGDPAGAQARAAAAGRLFAAQRRDWWSAHCRLLIVAARLAGGQVTRQLAADAARLAEQLSALGSSESAQARLLAGRAALLLGRAADAEHQLTIAARARHRGPALSRASGWLASALLADSAGQSRRTLAACRHGLAVLSAHSLTLGGAELRAQATAHGLELAALAQRVCLRTGSARQLLAWSERWRATALAVPPVRPPDDRELQRDLARYRDVVSRLAAARAAGAAGGPGGPAGGLVLPLQREQQQLERQIRAGRMRVSGLASGTAATAGTGAGAAGAGAAGARAAGARAAGAGAAGAGLSLDAAALLTELGDSQLAEIAEIDGELLVILCGDGQVRRYRAGGVADAVREVGYARSALSRLAYGAFAYGTAGHAADALAELESAGLRMQRLLLGAAARRLDGRPVVVVPPARLHGIPWAMLPALTSSAVCVAPSARAWLRARAAAVARGGLLTSGGGRGSGYVPGPAGASVAGEVLVAGGPGLAAGAAELAAVAGMYQRATVLHGGSATAAGVLRAMDGCWLAHIAAHGSFRIDNPLFSALRMDDGPLTVHDFERLKRAPYRLILPCCDSARVAAAGADEMLGLAAALLPLGTAGIVASVGPVSDEAAVAVMLDLHDGLRHGLTSAQALRDSRASAAVRGPLATATAWSFVALGAA